MKKMLLASNGEFAIEGMKMLFDDLKKIKIAYITTASKGADDLDYLQYHKDKMDELGIDYEELDIDGKNKSKLYEILKGKNAVYVEGGNTFYLLKAIRESDFDEVIKKLIEKGMAYIGSSAGSYVACPTIEMSTWKPTQKERFGMTDFTALNLVPFLVMAHYDPEMKNILKEKISNTKYPVRILQDGQGILVEGESYKFIGKGKEVVL